MMTPAILTKIFFDFISCRTDTHYTKSMHSVPTYPAPGARTISAIVFWAELAWDQMID